MMMRVGHQLQADSQVWSVGGDTFQPETHFTGTKTTSTAVICRHDPASEHQVHLEEQSKCLIINKCPVLKFPSRSEKFSDDLFVGSKVSGRPGSGPQTVTTHWRENISKFLSFLANKPIFVFLMCAELKNAL